MEPNSSSNKQCSKISDSTEYYIKALRTDVSVLTTDRRRFVNCVKWMEVHPRLDKAIARLKAAAAELRGT